MATLWLASPPAEIPVKFTVTGPESSFTNTSDSEANVGGAFVGGRVTRRRKVFVAVVLPSLAEIVMVEEPAALVAGWIFMVRFEVVPVKVMLPAGTRTVSAALADTVRLLAGDSSSVTINGIRPVDVFIAMVTSAMSDITGVSLNEFTVTLKLLETEPPF